MNNQYALVDQLFSIRNKYDAPSSVLKKDLLEKITTSHLRKKDTVITYYNTLLFLIAYPDNKTICEMAEARLKDMTAHISKSKMRQYYFYNTGLTGSQICAEFGYEVVKWLRKTYQRNVFIDSVTAYDGQVMSILSAVMPQVESEILQDENATWQQWLKQSTAKGDDLLDTLIKLFEQSSIRPEVKDELWTALKINITIKLTTTTQLPAHLVSHYYHRSLLHGASLAKRVNDKPVKINLSTADAEKVIECGRMLLVRYLREIDPISFSDPALVTYYRLPRGFSIALFGMRHERRHPVDSYMGYLVFKNGLPVSYAGSWVLFDSARIGLNIFAPYRGGESLHIFELILKTHKEVYRLNRFSVDPYQIGKNNADGIHSGAFWVYHKFGFRPIETRQKQLAEMEAKKIKELKGYRSPAGVLKQLAESRMELSVGKTPSVRFDATDISRLYRYIVKTRYAGNRKMAEQQCYPPLIKLLKLEKHSSDINLGYVLQNWCVLLMEYKLQLQQDSRMREDIRAALLLKATGDEERCIRKLQQCTPLRRLLSQSVSALRNG